jgi:hypothetical protein
MAIACLRLLTFRPDPLFSVPRFRRRIADSTFFDAAFPYLAMGPSSTDPDLAANCVLIRAEMEYALHHDC